MLLGYRKAPLDSKRFIKRRHHIIGAQFRKRFVLLSVFATGGTLAIFFVPLCLFLNQNYSSFQSLAYDIHPQILQNLENETTWLVMFALISFVALITLVGLWTHQMTRQLSIPLEKVQKHMLSVIGGNLAEPFDIQDKEILKDYLKGYEALVHFLNVEQRLELDYLRRLNIDAQERDAYKAWKSLIELKEARLGMRSEMGTQIRIISNDALSDEADSERRAS